MDQITVSSAALALRAEKPLTPAMISALWEIAAILDEERTPANVPNSVWLTIPTTRLRGPDARQDNVWLRECLERMTGLKLSGQHRGDEWGAVLVAEWHITEGGSKARILIPPAGVHGHSEPALRRVSDCQGEGAFPPFALPPRSPHGRPRKDGSFRGVAVGCSGCVGLKENAVQ